MLTVSELENRIINADCLDILRQLPDKCVDLVLTDPPYGIGADVGVGRGLKKKTIKLLKKQRGTRKYRAKRYFLRFKEYQTIRSSGAEITFLAYGKFLAEGLSCGIR